VSRLEEVALLARVSKLFNACVKRAKVLGRPELSTHERLKMRFPDLKNEESDEKSRLTKAAASAELFATLQQMWLGCPAINGIDLCKDQDEKDVTYVADEHVRLVASFPNLRSVCLEKCVGRNSCCVHDYMRLLMVKSSHGQRSRPRDSNRQTVETVGQAD